MIPFDASSLQLNRKENKKKQQTLDNFQFVQLFLGSLKFYLMIGNNEK
jgi:hypothetical protein